jgi:hypothetical protein
MINSNKTVGSIALSRQRQQQQQQQQQQQRRVAGSYHSLTKIQSYGKDVERGNVVVLAPIDIPVSPVPMGSIAKFDV